MSTLGDLTTPKIDQAGPPRTGEFTYVDISSVDNRLKQIVEPKRLPVAAAPSRARQSLQVGDVLVSMTRPNLNAVAIVPPELDGAVGSTGFHVLRALREIEPRWLFYSVQTRDFVESMSSLVQGALYPAVRPKDIREFGIEAPPLDKQRRAVAEIEKQFSRLNEAVANIERAKVRLSAYRASVLSAVQRGGLCGMSYSDWPVKSIGELATRVQYGSSAKTSASEKGVPVLRMGNIENGELVLDDLKYLPADHAEFPELFLETGDLLFNRTNSPELVGKVAVYRGTPSLCSYASYLIRLRFNEEVIPEFVACVLNSPFGRAWVRSVVTQQVGQANVNGSKLKAFQFRLPPTSLQRKLVAEAERHLSMMRETETQLTAAERRSERLRGKLLANAFPKLRAYEK